MYVLHQFFVVVMSYLILYKHTYTHTLAHRTVPTFYEWFCNTVFLFYVNQDMSAKKNRDGKLSDGYNTA